jgi:hypothetical protein
MTLSKDQIRVEALSEQLDNGCWKWVGSVANSGYGLAQSSQLKKVVSAHRLSYMAFKGEIPERMVVAHACDNPLCVNPDHLWLATHAENSADMVKKGRSAKHEKCGKSKLNEKQVQFIRESNLSHRKLGEMFGVSHANIGYIKRGATWI